MKATEIFLYFFSGLAFFSSIGIVLARRMVMSAFSLGLLLLAIAGIYASLQLQAAFFTQLLLYIGGLMVLIGFALQLYPEPPALPALRKVRDSFGKGFIMLVLMILCLLYAPWQSLSDGILPAKQVPFLAENYSLRSLGRHLLLDFPFEFEWLGILMLAGLLVVGWFLKDALQTGKK
jgi:NADH:ubiquinone oxidoreductase subunit 6 (subunit J)